MITEKEMLEALVELTKSVNSIREFCKVYAIEELKALGQWFYLRCSNS